MPLSAWLSLPISAYCWLGGAKSSNPWGFCPLGLALLQGFERLKMENFFEQFQGADLERLADCLNAVKKAGLKTSKYTQAGVNESSGNVWLWDESWTGCVACSIGFDVFWVWSCSNCGEESEFQTYSELEEFVDEQNKKTDHEGCLQCCDEVEESETYDEYGINTKNSFNTEVEE